MTKLPIKEMKLTKIGNSYFFRVPKALVTRTGLLKEGTEYDVIVNGLFWVRSADQGGVCV